MSTKQADNSKGTFTGNMLYAIGMAIIFIGMVFEVSIYVLIGVILQFCGLIPIIEAIHQYTDGGYNDSNTQT